MDKAQKFVQRAFEGALNSGSSTQKAVLAAYNAVHVKFSKVPPEYRKALDQLYGKHHRKSEGN